MHTHFEFFGDFEEIIEMGKLRTNCFRFSSKSLRKLATFKEIATDWEQIAFELAVNR